MNVLFVIYPIKTYLKRAISQDGAMISARGKLANTICMCGIHDLLFESGYIKLTDEYNIIFQPSRSNYLNYVLSKTVQFKLPIEFFPDKSYLAKHRNRFKNGWYSYFRHQHHFNDPTS